jgi:hypothetical protein
MEGCQEYPQFPRALQECRSQCDEIYKTAKCEGNFSKCLAACELPPTTTSTTTTVTTTSGTTTTTRP